ncbi:MAG: GIY-YIG nuclease family protein [bacterium]|nr:GIY-YIG nuclease family protein [bacterium]
MYAVYILHSSKTGRYYTGMTQDVERRLREHNAGKTTSTRTGIPWTIVYREYLTNRREAWLREHQIKKFKGGGSFRQLVSPPERSGARVAE